MVQVRRANVILDIKDEEVPQYLEMGYEVLDDKGEVVQSGIPTDTATLKLEYVKHVAEIEELKAEIEQLKKKQITPVSKKAKKAE